MNQEHVSAFLNTGTVSNSSHEPQGNPFRRACLLPTLPSVFEESPHILRKSLDTAFREQPSVSVHGKKNSSGKDDKRDIHRSDANTASGAFALLRFAKQGNLKHTHFRGALSAEHGKNVSTSESESSGSDSESSESGSSSDEGGGDLSEGGGDLKDSDQEQ